MSRAIEVKLRYRVETGEPEYGFVGDMRPEITWGFYEQYDTQESALSAAHKVARDTEYVRVIDTEEVGR